MRLGSYFTGGITPGTARANKALVPDDNKDLSGLRNLTVTGNIVSSSQTISPTELGYLDGAGLTVVASKVVVADADKDIVGVRKIWLGTNGAAGFAGELDIQDGANPGVSAALTYADLVKADGVTAGAVTVSKFAAYNAAGFLARSSATLAALGNSQGTAAPIVTEFVAVTDADGTKGVVLPTAVADVPCIVINTNASNNLLVYPATGAQINALGANNAFTVTPGQMALFIGRSATLWYTAAATDTVTGLTASAAELNYNDIAALGTGAASKAVVLDADGRYRLPSTGTFFNAGKETKAQAAPAAKTVTAGITAAELVAGLITTTGVTAPSIHQLPTGTEIDAAIPGIATGDSFDFTIINTGTGASDDATITVNTDVTIVGNPTVGALTDATIISGSGTFRARRSAANAYVVYRIA